MEFATTSVTMNNKTSSSINHRPVKRPRAETVESCESTMQQSSSSLVNDQSENNVLDLYGLVASKQWDQVTARAKENPQEVASCNREPSMLALCCRLGAPYSCVKLIVEAAPHRLRDVLDARGTPLHEAIVCEETSPQIIQLLLEVDESLGSDSPRAAVSQDVDGYTPLHLLIRRRFQAYVTGNDQASPMLEILDLLVRSCAEAIVIPDRGEYEEPPIVMALKANVYAPVLQSEESPLMEQYIYHVVECMLQHYPQAASRVFQGYRGHYTALHSAVFHGRSPDTIALLLDAERRAPSSQKACLLGNTQGELPLHFCAMRGEPPRTVRLLAEAAPEAISQRDASGLTPMHWLWIRFVSTLLTIDDGRGESLVLPLRRRPRQSGKDSDHLAFATLKQSDFEADLQLLRRVDPSVDFLRMRHIPSQVQDEAEALQWADRTAALLKGVRDRFELEGRENDNHDDRAETVPLNHLEAVSVLFWTKVISLLRCLATGEPQETEAGRHGVSVEARLLKTAFENECCPPLVARLVALLLPSELSKPDEHGRLALHYAAKRPWHAWEWPREDGTSDAASLRLLHLESASLLRNAMALSPHEAARRIDCDGRLPLHCMITTCIQACSAGGRSASEDPLLEMVEILGYFVQLYPESLNVMDPRTNLLPFLQASAEAAAARASSPQVSVHEEFPLSIVYLILREDPSLVQARLMGDESHTA